MNCGFCAGSEVSQGAVSAGLPLGLDCSRIPWLMHLGHVGFMFDAALVVFDSPRRCRMHLGCVGCTLVVLDAPWPC